MIRFLRWVGLIRLAPNPKSCDPANCLCTPSMTVRWPISFAPAHIFRSWRDFKGYCLFWGPVYVFRNRPGIIKWEAGRLLPRRWGIGFFGLIEIGDRG